MAAQDRSARTLRALLDQSLTPPPASGGADRLTGAAYQVVSTVPPKVVSTKALVSGVR